MLLSKQYKKYKMYTHKYTKNEYINYKEGVKRKGNKDMETVSKVVVNRGDIVIVDIPQTAGSKQYGVRPMIVCCNLQACKYSPVITAVPVTSNLDKKKLPTHVIINEDSGLYRTSLALVEQMMPVDKSTILKTVGRCTMEQMTQIDRAIMIQNGLSTERFSLEKAKTIYVSIKSADRFIKETNIPQEQAIFRKTLVESFDSYCKEFGYTRMEVISMIKGNVNSSEENRRALQLMYA
jgi:mRNA interferase MazF